LVLGDGASYVFSSAGPAFQQYWLSLKPSSFSLRANRRLTPSTTFGKWTHSTFNTHLRASGHCLGRQHKPVAAMVPSKEYVKRHTASPSTTSPVARLRFLAPATSGELFVAPISCFDLERLSLIFQLTASGLIHKVPAEKSAGVLGNQSVLPANAFFAVVLH
jgi:hypothetical protein